MGSLSEGIKYFAFQEGQQQGLEKGAILNSVKSIKSLTKQGFSIEQSIKMLDIDENIKDAVLKELEK